jgi:hypothetical protein
MTKQTTRDWEWADCTKNGEPVRVRVKAVILGDYCVHKTTSNPILFTVTHRATEVAVYDKLSAVQAAHLLRALQQAPTLSMNEAVVRNEVIKRRAKHHPVLAPWLQAVLKIVKAVVS